MTDEQKKVVLYLHMTAREARRQGIPVPPNIPDEATLEIPPGTEMRNGVPVAEKIELAWRWVKMDELTRDLKGNVPGITDEMIQTIAGHLRSPTDGAN